MCRSFTLFGMTLYPYALLLIAGAMLCFVLLLFVTLRRHKDCLNENLFALVAFVVVALLSLGGAAVLDALLKWGERGAFELRGATFYGGLAREIQEETRESPLKVRLNGLAAVISKLGYCAAALVALADLFNSLFLANGLEMARVLETLRNLPVLLEHLLHAATLGITVVVVAVPEGLPMMITVVLSSNMLRMLRDHVLVRKLVGIETSGSLNILFTDKTGTITRGRLQVSTVVTGAGKAYEAETFRGRKPLYELLELSCWLNTSSTVSEGRALGGNATDRALLEYAISGEPKGYSVVETLPFDSARKYSMARIRGRRNLVLVKGAPEKLLPACTRYYDEEGQVRAMQAGREVRKRWEELAHNAVRVLAVAVADTMAGERFGSLTLVGLVGIRDEIRPESRGAIQQCRL